MREHLYVNHRPGWTHTPVYLLIPCNEVSLPSGTLYSAMATDHNLVQVHYLPYKRRASVPAAPTH